MPFDPRRMAEAQSDDPFRLTGAPFSSSSSFILLFRGARRDDGIRVCWETRRGWRRPARPDFDQRMARFDRRMARFDQCF